MRRVRGRCRTFAKDRRKWAHAERGFLGSSIIERVASVKCFTGEVVCQMETISDRTMIVRGHATANDEGFSRDNQWQKLKN